MEIFQNLRQPNLTNEFDNKLVTNFVKSFHGFDVNKLVTVPVLPGPKGEFGGCSKYCKEKVSKFGGEVVYGVIIDMDDNHIYATFHCIWKYNGKLFDVTKPEMDHNHNINNILFIPANEPDIFIIRKFEGEDFYFFPKPLLHVYKKSMIPKQVLESVFNII